MNKPAHQSSGHLFLASLGKTRLRPGGREATERILAGCQITSDTKLLEVAPNMGTTAIHIAKTYGCEVTGIDLHAPSVEKAKENIKKEGLEGRIYIQTGNAMSLPFDDETFDVVINEAMLSMLPPEHKAKAVKEYYRVLKPGGRLATHDLLLKKDPDSPGVEQCLSELRQVLRVHAHPMTAEQWRTLLVSAGFNDVQVHCGNMSLVSLKGLIVDEGWEGTIQILTNALKDEAAKERLFRMISIFDDHVDIYGHLTCVSTK